MDFKPSIKSCKSYIVCSTGRSGSTLLCKTLERLKLYGKPEEYFHHKTVKRLGIKEDPELFSNYLNSVLQEGTDDSGVFGIKMHWWQMYNFLQMARQHLSLSDATDLDVLRSIFPDPKFIYIWRRDMARQAVSTVIALQTQEWRKTPTQSESDVNEGGVTAENSHQAQNAEENSSLKFQPLKIFNWEKNFHDQNRRWRQFFAENGIDCYEIVYEDFIKNFNSEIINVSQHIGIDQNLIKDQIEKPLKKQSNITNEAFLQRYQRIPKLALRIAHKFDQQFKQQRKSVSLPKSR